MRYLAFFSASFTLFFSSLVAQQPEEREKRRGEATSSASLPEEQKRDSAESLPSSVPDAPSIFSPLQSNNKGSDEGGKLETKEEKQNREIPKDRKLLVVPPRAGMLQKEDKIEEGDGTGQQQKQQKQDEAPEKRRSVERGTESGTERGVAKSSESSESGERSDVIEEQNLPPQQSRQGYRPVPLSQSMIDRVPLFENELLPGYKEARSGFANYQQELKEKLQKEEGALIEQDGKKVDSEESSPAGEEKKEEKKERKGEEERGFLGNVQHFLIEKSRTLINLVILIVLFTLFLMYRHRRPRRS